MFLISKIFIYVVVPQLIVQINYATTNNGKFHSLQRDLGKYGIKVIQRPIELIEPRSSDIQEIALSKITQAYPQILQPTVVMDAGFYIPALNGFPRTFVKFSLDTVGLEGMIRLLEGKPRECYFGECLAYMDPSMQDPHYLFTEVEGIFASEKKGEMQDHFWSELALVFIPKGSDKTLAEMSKGEYIAWRKLSREENSLGKKLYEWLS